MSKIKMRCSQCGKSFKSANARQLICPECEEKARKERAAKARGAQLPASAPTPAPRQILPAKPARPAAPASAPQQHWLDRQADVKIAPPEPPASSRPPRLDVPERRPSAPPAAPSAPAPGNPPRAHALPSSQTRHTAQQPGTGAAATAPAQKPRKPDQQKRADGARPRSSKAATPKPKREPRQPTPPFAPTPEQIAAIEQRYLELTQPGEFDGIRTQIAKELGVPKSAVKKVVRTLRERQDIPSWWDLQAYHGSPEDLERIRAAYTPLLPKPAVGVHKQIAALLNLPAGTVYQAIKVIRAEMNLPQYNPPQAADAPLEAR